MNGWIDPAQALPAERENVRFVVIGHRRSLTGVYENHSFCSRWGSYEPATVELWRKLGNAPRVRRRLRPAGDLHRGSDRPARGRTVATADVGEGTPEESPSDANSHRARDGGYPVPLSEA